MVFRKWLMVLTLGLTMSGVAVAESVEDNLITDGEFFVGCNYWCRNAGMYMWSQWDPATLEKEIGELAKNGVEVMRVFPLWSDFQPLTGDCWAGGSYRSFRFRDNCDLPNAAGVDDEMIERFRFLCDVCERHHIRLIVGIVTGWMSARQFVPSVFEEKNVLVDPTAIMWQTRFVKYFVARTKDKKAIVAWDYGNECNCMGSGSAGQAAFYNWMDHIGMAIRSQDATRPVVSGMHGLSTFDRHDSPIRLNGEISDILCTHPYALYVPGCGKEAFNTMRTALHPTAESLLYRDLGGKPCFIEEIGNLGPGYASEARTAAGIRTTLFSAWAHDLKGLLWWCNSDQENLDFPPYSLTSYERELGLLRQDYSPKPVMSELAAFQQFRKSLPFAKLPPCKADAVILAAEKVPAWPDCFGAYLLAKQAGFNPVFAGAESEQYPAAPVYIVPSVRDEKGYTYRAQKKIYAAAERGATVIVIYGGDSRFTRFREASGCEVDYGAAAPVEREFALQSAPQRKMKCRDKFTVRLLPREAEVLAATADGEPVMTVNRLGKGRLVVINSPIDRETIERTDCLTGENPVPYYTLLVKARELSGVRGVVTRGDCPWVGITEHLRADGSAVVIAINFEPRELSCPITLNGRLGKVFRGQVAADSIRLPANEAAVFEVLP